MAIINRSKGDQESEPLSASEFIAMGPGTTGIDSDGDLCMVVRDRDQNDAVIFLGYGGIHALHYEPNGVTYTPCDIEVRRVG